MKTETIKVGRFRLTPQFVERACKRYARRIRQGAMPTEAVQGELMSPEWFGESVNTKAAYIVSEIGGLAKVMSSPERETHAAMQKAAGEYGLGILPEPDFPEDEPPPQPSAPSQAQPQQKPQSSNPAPDDEGDKGEGEESSASDDSGDNGDREDCGKADVSDDGDDSGDADAAGECHSEANGGDGEKRGSEADAGEGGANDEPQDASQQTEEVSAGSSVGDPNKEAPKPTIDLADERRAFARVIDGQKELPVQDHPIESAEAWLTRANGRSNESPELFDHSGRIVDLTPSSQLIARMRAELMSVSRHRASRDKDSGDVDFTKLVDIAQRTNLDRVFYTVTHARRLNTAVQIIIDVSGSMIGTRGPSVEGAKQGAKGTREATWHEVAGSKIGTAVTVAILLCDCLEKLRVACEVLAFSDDVRCVKPWHEKMHSGREKIARLACVANTNLPNAMLSGLQSLASRREEKHVQAVIIDGDVGDSEQINCAALRKLNPKLRTFGFGVGVDLPSNVFTRTVSNLTTANMMETIVEQLRDALLHG